VSVVLELVVATPARALGLVVTAGVTVLLQASQRLMHESVVVEKPDMPPPPSPVSSTCSETGSVSGGSSKKHKRPAPPSDEDKRGDEEEWVLKDVIFIEDVKNVPVGRVLKVDGAYAAVRFPANKYYCGKEAKALVNSASTGNEDPVSLLQDCRLLRKDELQVLDTLNSFLSFLV